MNIKKWFETRRYRKRLAETRRDIEALHKKAATYRTHISAYYRDPRGKFRPIEDFMNKPDGRRYRNLCVDEWALSKLLGENPQWGSVKSLQSDGAARSPEAFLYVPRDNSIKIGYEYVELVNQMVCTVDGKWSSYPSGWMNVDDFMNEGWGRTEEFYEAADAWHAAETAEEKQAVVDKYKKEHGS